MSLPGNKLPAENSFTYNFKVDKIVHILLFFILSYTILLYFKKSNKKHLKNKRTQIIASLEEHLRHGFLVRSIRFVNELNTFVYINGNCSYQL